MYKWTNDVKIKVHGNPTSADIDTLEQVVSELNDLQSEITLNIVKRNANVEIYFAPESRFDLFVKTPRQPGARWG